MNDRQNNSNRFMKDPQLDFIETRYSSFSRQVFDKHAHETYSIGIVHQGSSLACLQNHIRSIRKADTIFIPPGVLHACNPRRYDVLVYHMMYIDCSLLRTLSEYLFKHNDPAFSCAVLHQADLYRDFHHLCTLMSHSHDRLEKQSQLYHAVSKLLNLVNAREVPGPCMQEENRNMKRAHEYLMDHLEQNISLEELASQAGLSPYHFLRVFRNIYGMTPHAYRLQKRIQAGKKMIAGGIPIAQVACQTGFTDQSHFTRRFKACVGMTPNEFQQNLLHCQIEK